MRKQKYEISSEIDQELWRYSFSEMIIEFLDNNYDKEEIEAIVMTKIAQLYKRWSE